jgi:ABC-type lipoprotein release transport system permease subunit
VSAPNATAGSTGAAGYAVGDEVLLLVKGVTNGRTYKVSGRILSLHGHLAQVEYDQPWASVNRRKKTVADLRTCRKIKRRLRHNTTSSATEGRP